MTIYTIVALGIIVFGIILILIFGMFFYFQKKLRTLNLILKISENVSKTSKCPKCSNNLIVKKQEETDNFFIVCDNQTNCGFVIKNPNDNNIDEFLRKVIVKAAKVPRKYFSDHLNYKDVEKNEALLSKIEGAEQSNKKFFEEITKTQLSVNRTKKKVEFSTLSIKDRIIARNVLERFRTEANFLDKTKIKKFYEQEVKKFDNEVIFIGKKVIKEHLNLKKIDKRLYHYVGLLNYRESYQQNILQHSIECALIAEQIATRLKLNTATAKLCAFFHDIGKATNIESKVDHVKEGMKIAKETNLPTVVFKSIKYHHEQTQTLDATNNYVLITKIADRVSAATPGARKSNSLEEISNRKEKLENIVLDSPTLRDMVDKVRASKSGWLLEVYISKEHSQKSKLVIDSVSKSIEEDKFLCKFAIDVVVIYNNKMKKITINDN